MMGSWVESAAVESGAMWNGGRMRAVSFFLDGGDNVVQNF
jgi:hypothetical protein